MISQNKIFQKREAQQPHVVNIIKAYFSSSFFRIAAQFESRTQVNIPYVDYQLSKLPTAQRTGADMRSMLLLFGGFNKNVKITIQLIRAIQYEYKVLCLAMDKIQQSQTRFFPLAIIFPDAAKAEQWASNVYYLATLVAYDPFVSFGSHYKVPFLVLRHDSLQISPLKAVSIKDWHSAKLFANESFKRKQYKNALVFYELALGLLWSQKNTRDRAILHSNAAQSFFELNLCQNTLLYADTAILLDNTFGKSYYRKLCSHLELQQYEKIPQVLMLMANVCSKEEFTTAHQRYTRYMANKTGIFNWFDIIIKRSSSFGQYLSCKVECSPDNLELSKHRKYYAKSFIPKYELIAVQKTAIYSEQKSCLKKTNFMRDFFEEIYQLLQLEQRFQERILGMLKDLGKKVESQGDINHSRTTEAIFHSHCFKTLFVNESNIAICPQYTRFLIDEDSPNCTFLNMQGGFFYFVVRDIQPNEMLTIQIFNKTIESPHQSLQIFSNTSKRGLDAYHACKAMLFEKKMYNTAIRYLWKMFREPDVSRSKVILEIFEVMEHFPQWEIVILILCQLQTDHSFPYRDRCKRGVLQVFVQFFKIPNELAEEVIDTIIYD